MTIAGRLSSRTMDCFLDRDSPFGPDTCSSTSHRCHKPFAFPPGASLVRGAAARRFAARVPADGVVGWADNAWVEVLHQAACSASHCNDRGVWFYSAFGCSGVRWNVGRSLRAFNRLHAVALLAGRGCEGGIDALEQRFARSQHLLRDTFGGGERASRRQRMCNFVNTFSQPSYALNLSHAAALDKRSLIGLAHLDKPLLQMARARGYESVQLLLQPAGAPHAYLEHRNVALDALRTELWDIRDTRRSCDIDAEPGAVLLRNLQTVAGRCTPTSTAADCLACANSSAEVACVPDCERELGRHRSVPCASIASPQERRLARRRAATFARAWRGDEGRPPLMLPSWERGGAWGALASADDRRLAMLYAGARPGGASATNARSGDAPVALGTAGPKTETAEAGDFVRRVRRALQGCPLSVREAHKVAVVNENLRTQQGEGLRRTDCAVEIILHLRSNGSTCAPHTAARLAARLTRDPAGVA